MQYICPDIMYAVNRLSNHNSAPSSPAFKGIKKFIRCLSGFPHCPTMYPSGIDGTNTHDIHQDIYPGELHYQKISNGLVDFVDGGEGCGPNGKKTMAFGILFIFGVAVHWSAKTQPESAAHYTDS